MQSNNYWPYDNIKGDYIHIVLYPKQPALKILLPDIDSKLYGFSTLTKKSTICIYLWIKIAKVSV